MEITLVAMQIVLAFGNICIMLYALKVFLTKPRNAMEERIATLEVKMKEVEASLQQGNDNFRSQKQTNEVLLHSTLALIEFEIQYCIVEKKSPTPELQKAKEDLQAYLSKK